MHTAILISSLLIALFSLYSVIAGAITLVKDIKKGFIPNEVKF